MDFMLVALPICLGRDLLSDVLRHYIPEMMLTDYMSQVKKEEEDLSALKTAFTYQYNDLRLHTKARRKTDYSHPKQY